MNQMGRAELAAVLPFTNTETNKRLTLLYKGQFVSVFVESRC